MFLTILNGICLIILGQTSFTQWEALNVNNANGSPTEMLMPVFFGGAFLICVAFSKEHFRHGLYGGLIIAMLGVISGIYRLYQYGGVNNILEPKSKIIIAMTALCLIQLIITWQAVKKDRHT